jgi:hypothetical protein
MATYQELMDAARNAHSAGDSEGAARLVQMASSAQQETKKPIDFSIPTPEALSTSSVKEQPITRSYGEEAGRQAGLTGRYLTEGALGGVDAAANLVRKGLNVALPKNMQINQMSLADKITSGLNLPQPENQLERMVAAPSRALVGTATGGAIAKASQPVSQVGNIIKEALTSNMPSQAAASVGSGFGSQIAQEAGGGMWSQLLGSLIGGGVGTMAVKPVATTQSVQQMQNVNKDTLLNKAQKEGYIALPSDVGAGKGAKALETISGKFKSEELASAKNQNVSNNLTRKYLGLPESAPINVDTLDNIRSSMSPAYEAVKQTGTINLGEKNPFSKLVENVQFAQGGKNALMGEVKPNYAINSSDAVEQIKQLRATGDAYYKSGTNIQKPNPVELALGRQYIAEANKLENILENHVSQIGQPELIQNLKNARKEIAKTYTVQNALVGENVIDYRKIGKLIDKKPITGELELAARFAKEFPRVNKPVAYQPTAFTLPDVYGTAIGGALDLMTGVPLATALPAARVGGRYLMESAPFQQRYVRPQYPSNAMKVLPYASLLDITNQQK